jgi:uncharacterized membrane protein (UPF0127 family)
METQTIALILLLFLIILLVVYFLSAKGERRRLTIINQDGGEVSVNAEIADNPATKMKGLMGRPSLPENDGMLFVFDKPGLYAFWMLNTSMPLDAIHFDGDGAVVDIVEMEPCGLNATACKAYVPKVPSKSVLEVNQGFARKNGIVVGKSRLK